MKYNTVIQKINRISDNNIFIKRDDLIPYSFGGNKVRIAYEYINDLIQKKCDCMIAYGNCRSNLCRVICNLCKKNNIECIVISPIEDDEIYFETNNSILVNFFEGKIISCYKNEVAQTIENVKNECISKGKKYYFIYDDDNLKVVPNAYIKAYEEIKEYEKNNKIYFDCIFLASGTGMTQSGLIIGKEIYKDISRKIIGISIARNEARGKEKIKEILELYDKKYQNGEILFTDKYICNGYGKYNSEIEKNIKKLMIDYSIPLDTTYTGKAFTGMEKYLNDNNIKNKNILFIHTGGLPLFFDKINLFKENI